MNLTERLLNRDPSALAKLISQVENRVPGYPEILDQIFSHTGHSYRIGITGPPGAGKSTLVDKLVRLLRAEGKTVGVLACDPTSPFTGGALLGDRIRMQDLVSDDGVFIRSMATRGSLGGLAKSAQEAALLLEAFGFDWIILETIGVGQVEVDIVQAADTTVLVLVPQSGDVIQAMKAGLMEIGDVFVVNKSDQGEADLAYRNLQTMLGLSMHEWMPPIVKTVASQNQGIVELRSAIERHKAYQEKNTLSHRRRVRLKAFLQMIIEEELQLQLWHSQRLKTLDAQLEQILNKHQTPYRAAKEILQSISSSLQNN
ncbi:methylmalonyl Co-A mutase-associated GTPase MeaB [Candidatus Acetothermia bacterium]|nr:methylmalonyl Co-A mutase-associated GTPase MeaB [Candidatus Acetothermia bacterium]